MYCCSKCGRPWDDNRARDNELTCTRRCGGKLVLVEPLALPDLEGCDFGRLPYPVALTARRLARALRASGDILKTLFLLKDCFEATIKYLGAVLLTEYRRSAACTAEHTEVLLKSMVRPSLRVVWQQDDGHQSSSPHPVLRLGPPEWFQREELAPAEPKILQGAGCLAVGSGLGEEAVLPVYQPVAWCFRRSILAIIDGQKRAIYTLVVPGTPCEADSLSEPTGSSGRNPGALAAPVVPHIDLDEEPGRAAGRDG